MLCICSFSAVQCFTPSHLVCLVPMCQPVVLILSPPRTLLLVKPRRVEWCLRVHPHGNSLCVWTHILHHLADCPHGSCKRTFLKPEIWKTLPLRSPVYSESAYFAYRWRHRPTPRPLAFDFLTLQHLITTTTTTTTMADYILVLQKILSLSGLRGQNILFLCHYAEQKRIMDNRIRHIVFFFLCSASPSTVCLFTARKLYVHAPSLLHFWWISSATYRPGIN